jgi:GNAT superfamily N-acetyltransferase
VGHDRDVHVLPVAYDDMAFLSDCILVEAAYPNGTRAPTDAHADAHLIRYLEGWGRTGDVGLVAWDGSMRVGAAWTRLFTPDRAGYGFVDAATPELTVAVVGSHRGRGLGRALVAGMLDLAAVDGHERVSLSVDDRRNQVALGLYRSFGFTEVGRDEGGSLTMVAAAAPAPPDEGSVGPPVARAATALDGPALARLREVMFVANGLGGRSEWVRSFLHDWPSQLRMELWLATVVDDSRGRPVASAVAAVEIVFPAPGRLRGSGAHIGSVATEPAWRRRGCSRAAVTALLDMLDAKDVESTTLNATPEAADLYASLGFRAGPVAMRRDRPGPLLA